MTTGSRRLGLTFAAALFCGCTLLPQHYETFDDWATGDPDTDYESYGLEGVPPMRIVYGALLSPLYAARDGLRIALAPFGFAWFAAQGPDAVPTVQMIGPVRELPPLTDPEGAPEL